MAGINHFLNPGFYESIMPPWLPHHNWLVSFSGFCEILFGTALLINVMRRTASILIIVLLVAVFPANVQMMINYLHGDIFHLCLTVVRLPLQFLLIRWAYIYSRPAIRD